VLSHYRVSLYEYLIIFHFKIFQFDHAHLISQKDFCQCDDLPFTDYACVSSIVTIPKLSLEDSSLESIVKRVLEEQKLTDKIEADMISEGDCGENWPYDSTAEQRLIRLNKLQTRQRERQNKASEISMLV
jgi:hypothetical protein